MKAAGSGSVIITSSTAGIYGYPNRAPYAAAKWAMIGLMKTLAMELGPFGIRANAICPGSVEGPRMEGVLAREAAVKGMTRDQVVQALEDLRKANGMQTDAHARLMVTRGRKVRPVLRVVRRSVRRSLAA